MKLIISIVVVVVAACGLGIGAHAAFEPVANAVHAVLYNITTDNRGLHD